MARSQRRFDGDAWRSVSMDYSKSRIRIHATSRLPSKTIARSSPLQGRCLWVLRLSEHSLRRLPGSAGGEVLYCPPRLLPVALGPGCSEDLGGADSPYLIGPACLSSNKVSVISSSGSVATYPRRASRVRWECRVETSTDLETGRPRASRSPVSIPLTGALPRLVWTHDDSSCGWW